MSGERTFGTRRVLLLASYCSPNDENGCIDSLPCLDCLRMCNLVTMKGEITLNDGGWDFNRQAANLPTESEQ